MPVLKPAAIDTVEGPIDGAFLSILRSDDRVAEGVVVEQDGPLTLVRIEGQPDDGDGMGATVELRLVLDGGPTVVQALMSAETAIELSNMLWAQARRAGR